jgi:predicted dehydrogenase
MDSYMRTVLIIGAGQLGSRHLQGLVKYSEAMEVYVLDPSIDSLRIAQEREQEITHMHKVIYSQSWEILPASFDLVIIATSANVREAITVKLLENHKVRFLILEKVLFQELGAYQRVHDLLDRHNVTAYVNHPRRMFESYKGLKQNLKQNERSIYGIVGGNWGLGCNALHFLDLFVYLSGKKIKDIDVNVVDNELLESARKGFVEFTGTLAGHLEDGSFFSITSFKGDSSPATVTVFNNEQRFIIQEGGTPQIHELTKENLFKPENKEFRIQYQSDLTTDLVKELFENNACSLPSYDDARHSHELFINALLGKYNMITGLHATTLPIT